MRCYGTRGLIRCCATERREGSNEVREVGGLLRGCQRQRHLPQAHGTVCTFLERSLGIIACYGSTHRSTPTQLALATDRGIPRQFLLCVQTACSWPGSPVPLPPIRGQRAAGSGRAIYQPPIPMPLVSPTGPSTFFTSSIIQKQLPDSTRAYISHRKPWHSMVTPTTCHARCLALSLILLPGTRTQPAYTRILSV